MSVTVPYTLGLDRQRGGLYPCGVCGAVRQLTKTHVPPRAAGNQGDVRRASVRSMDSNAYVGRHTEGGLWVLGLCEDCNNAQSRYDGAYADFARGVRNTTGSNARRFYIDPNQPPPVAFAPGLVARSILFGLCALSPIIHVQHPQLAAGLRAHDPDLAIPADLTLRMGLVRGDRARINGAISYRRVLGAPTSYLALAEVYFNPLAWVLAPARESRYLDEGRWVDATDWVRYAAERTAVDLRNLASFVPEVGHPQHGEPDDWISMFSDEITHLVEGNLP